MNARIDPSNLSTRALNFATVPSGATIPYVAAGSGAPVVFIHGSLCDLRFWNGQLDALAQHFQCISVSLSHYWPVQAGSSERPFDWNTHVAEIAAFITALDRGPVHLVGHSRGGMIAFQLARQYPQLVKTLALADPGGPLDIDGSVPAALAPATLALRAHVAGLVDAGQLDQAMELFVDSVSMPGTWRKSPAGFRAMALDNAATLPPQFRESLPVYSRAAASGLACRTLLIEGARSPRVYRDNVEKLAGWIAQVDKRVIAGASHGMNVTHAAAFNRILQGFLSRAQD